MGNTIPSLTISEALARGLRRQDERVFAEKLPTIGNRPFPSRFGAYARELERRLHRTIGKRKFRRLSKDKNKVMWYVIVGHTEGRAQLGFLQLLRTHSGPCPDIFEFPLIATPHFVERLIQSTGEVHPPLIEVMQATYECICTCFQLDEGAMGWKLSGSLWVSLPEYLVLGQMTKEMCELKTILRSDVLEPDKLFEWRKLLEKEVRYIVR